MCGRFTIDIPQKLLIDLFGLAEPPLISPRYNVSPTQQIPIVRQYADEQNHLDYLRWGLIPSWAQDKSIGSKMINARSETVSEKPAFKQALRYRRCVVVASGFFEWKQEGAAKLPWYIRLKDGSPMVFAGLWETWKSAESEVVDSCTILTTGANRLIDPFHDRMPVVLDQEGCRAWLDRNTKNPASLVHLFQPYTVDQMEMWQVSPLVNNVRNESKDLITLVDNDPIGV